MRVGQTPADSGEITTAIGGLALLSVAMRGLLSRKRLIQTCYSRGKLPELSVQALLRGFFYV